MVRRRLAFALMVVFVFSSGAEVRAATDSERSDEDYELFSVLVDTIDQVERNYVKKIDRRELLEAAIKGVLTKLDPYSSYISPDDLGDFKRDVESKFGGIGIQITLDDGQLKVLSPLVGTPAYRAGLQAGDRIVKIEGKSTAGITIDEAVKRLKGENGTKVTITAIHPGNDEEIDLAIAREVIHMPTVLGNRRKADDHWDFMLDDRRKIGYLRLTAFSRDTSEELRAAMNELQSRGLRALIVDVRFNPGGLLSSAITICDMFIPEGRIVSTEGRNSKPRVWDAHREGTLSGFPMAVLVNRYSASASEIFAACLQDHQRAVVIGERTWGKGSVQNVIELEGGKSVLKLTTAGYLRPSGKNIHRYPDSKPEDEWGVHPNDGFKIRLSNTEMAGLVMSRRRQDIVQAHPVRAAAETEGQQPAAQDATPEPANQDEAPKTTPAADQKADEDAGKNNDAGKTQGSEKTDPPQTVETAAHGGTNFVDRQLQRAIEYLTTQLEPQKPAEEKADSAKATAPADGAQPK